MKDSAGAVLETYTHDAWNRLVMVEVDEGVNEQTLATYEYNGLNWRTIRSVDTDDDDDLELVREMYYCASWQLREERIDDNADDGGGASIDRHMQYIWGIRYIDDLAFRRENNNFTNDSPDITYEEERYHLHDVQFSTVAVIDETAKLIERVAYDPYGVARHHRAADLDGDGDTDGVDYTNHIAANWGNTGPGVGDLNRDGNVNVSDLLLWSGNSGSAAAAGAITQSNEDSIVGYDGYLFNAETQQYHVRFRCYAPELGRWIQRDPAGYVEGWNLYEYVNSQSVYYLDPLGLQSDESDESGCKRTKCKKFIVVSQEEDWWTDLATGACMVAAGPTPGKAIFAIGPGLAVSEIIASLEEDECICSISFWGHGNTGYFIAGDRVDVDDFGEDSVFAALLPYMCEGDENKIIVRACWSFDGDSGRELAETMASFFDCTVGGHNEAIGYMRWPGYQESCPGEIADWPDSKWNDSKKSSIKGEKTGKKGNGCPCPTSNGSRSEREISPRREMPPRRNIPKD